MNSQLITSNDEVTFLTELRSLLGALSVVPTIHFSTAVTAASIIYSALVIWPSK